ncbi:MAG: zinc ribbon domain-containing protein [Planctomycetota bacterium]|jgi:predicted  nucleic acid-binding Zn-ribbon protein
MGPVLHGLIKLQSVENRLRAVKSKLARCRRTVIFQENQLRTLQNGLEAKHEETKLTRVQVDRLELELKGRDEQISKLRAALNIAKTNKEYAAILTELNTSKADNAKIENQILDLMRNIEADEADCTQIQGQIDEQKGKLGELRADAETKSAGYESEIEEIQSEWDQAAETIPAEAIGFFKRVAETYDGEALAIASKENEKIDIYSCGGCFMRLPAETVNQLMTKDDIIKCPNCTRILVLETEES